jgi:O-antigen/teichoic acid export membrane protein
MSLKLQAAQGVKWKAITIVGRQLLSLAVFTTLARLLEPAAFGLVGLTGVYLALVSMIAEQGIGEALIQRHELEAAHLDTAFWLNVGCSSVLCLGTIATAGRIASYLGDPRLAPILRWLSTVLVINAASAIHGTLFLREMDFRRPAIRTLIANSMGGVVGVTMAFCGYGVWALVGQQLSVSVSGGVFFWLASPYRPSLRFSWRHLADLFHVSSAVFGTAILWFFSSRLDQIVIGRYAGVTALGMYVVAFKTPDLAKTIAHQPIAEISLPALSRLQHDHARMRNVIYSGMQLNSILSFAVFIGIAAAAPDLIPVLFGKKWAAVSTICSLLSIYTLLNALKVFFHPILVASGGAGRYLILNVFHVIGVSVACVIGIHFGTRYLVMGLILNAVILAFPEFAFIHRRIGMSAWEYCKPCLVPAVASVMMFAVVRAVATVVPLPSVVRLACEVFAGAAVYLGVLAVAAPTAMHKLLDVIRHVVNRPIAPSPVPAVQP